MRDLIVFLIVAGSLPTAFRQPYVGLLVFSWLAYMRPQDLCWGFARSMRLSFFVAVTMVVGWLVNEAGKRPFFKRDIRTDLMLTLLTLITIGYLLAENQDKYVTRYFIEFIKIVAVALFTTGQATSQSRLRYLYWTIVLCLGFYGVKTGVLGILGGGGPVLRGPGGMLEDNNDFALALVMNIPLLYYLGRGEGSKWIRQGCDFAIAMTMVAVLLTHSRGAFLSMTLTLLFLSYRSGRLVQAMGMMGLLAVAFFALAPDHVVDRIASIQQGTDESSAGARIKAWTVASRMIEANPVFGVGIRNFQVHWERHSDGFGEGGGFAYVAHNSYLQIWAEGGTIAFVVYMGLLLSVFWTSGRIRRRSKKRPEFRWAYDWARMMEATVAGFMLGAFFLNRGHFDLIYHWLGLTTCLSLVFERELRMAQVAGSPVVAEHQEATVAVRPRRWAPADVPVQAISQEAPRPARLWTRAGGSDRGAVRGTWKKR